MLATPTESIAPKVAFNLMVSLADEEDRVVRLVDISDTAADKAVHDIVVKAKPSETKFRCYKLGHRSYILELKPMLPPHRIPHS